MNQHTFLIPGHLKQRNAQMADDGHTNLCMNIYNRTGGHMTLYSSSFNITIDLE